ncbi:hypothetical protein H0H92_013769 [Tricholoma furcatifolium]|nr:hypothetical protein H0H92_013769 [Tricholoma furcatifolium]
MLLVVLLKLFVIAFPVIGVASRQVPVVDGVLGGVRTPSSAAELENVKAPATATSAAASATSTRTPGQLRVVENSGICETTPGVFQASGYGDLSSTESIWFWFFEARNNPETAPLALWFNGGVRFFYSTSGNWDVYYVPTANPDPYPPDITSYLATIQSQIGAQVTWEETNDDVYDNFASTGDWMRNSRPDLETVINAGIRTIVYDGDADYILNYDGVEAMVNALNTTFTPLFQQQQFATFTVAGQAAGLYKNAGTFSYVRIYGAGHEVPAYKLCK